MTAQQNTPRTFSPGRAILAAGLLAIAVLLLPTAAAQAAVPTWDISINAIGGDGGVYFAPGAQGTPASGPGYLIKATNSGTVPTTGTYTITDTLPPGLTVAPGTTAEDQNGNALTCGGTSTVVTCSGTEPVGPGEEVEMTVPVNVNENAVSTNEKSVNAINQAGVKGGGANGTVSASLKTYLTGGRPAWAIVLSPNPANFVPTSSVWNGTDRFYYDVSNVGGAASSGPITVVFNLSPGASAETTGAPGFSNPSLFTEDIGRAPCTIPTPEEVTCTTPGSVQPGELITGELPVSTNALLKGETVNVQMTISGGSAPNAGTSSSATIEDDDAPFGFIPGTSGLSAQLTGADGLPATQAGSHPGSLAVEIGFPAKKAQLPNEGAPFTATDGGVRDAKAYLPAGVIVNPLASPELCPEAQMEQDACPAETAVGLADLQSQFFGPTTFQSPLFNIDTPPGRPASFSFDAGGIGIYPHILGGIREGGNYSIASVANDVLELFSNPFMGLRVTFWGNPSDPVYNGLRGECDFSVGPPSCPVPPQSKPLVTLPTSCSGELAVDANIDSWGHPGEFIHKDGQVVDSNGNPTSITGCNALEFSPQLEARPTTNVADSPSGLDVDLEVPQTESFNSLATAQLKKTEIKLPEGLVINPSGANGLEGCSSAQIGIDNETGIPNGNPPTCPEAARLGTAEVDTPLLNHPMPGSVYLATPFDNQFNSMLAIYVVVNDAQSGTLIKLAGRIEADPSTGRLTTVFDNSPQLPFTDFKLNFFGGALAPLRTPATCGVYTTNSSITPWSAPESGPPATPEDTYEITHAPGTSGCASTPAGEPNSPSFDAGSEAPIAGAYSPLVVNLRRTDGSQQFSSVSVTPPPGLLGKLAGVPYCPEQDLAAAAAKTGKQELASPSCPAASQVGTVTIGSGAGPAPYYVQGHAYLTGAYKGAPLSLSVITPAVAGAYDLGTVVVRVALHINPANAQITADTDQVPTILKGIPLDIRSIQLKLDRPNFSINPTSCNALSFGGQLLSTLGNAVPLQSRYQLGECVNLGFKPSLTLQLKGGTKRASHPALLAALTARAGDANIARAQVKLPPTAQLDQANIGTVCTRPQFTANQCPSDSVYGKAEATSPLLDYTAAGPVYLRANPEHTLPDLVAALRGPANQPIEVDLSGTTDTVKGALRNTFEAVPDVPVSTFHFELFGGAHGLIQLNRNICSRKYTAEILLDSQSGKTHDTNPVVGTSCKHKPKPKHHRHHHRRGSRAN